jgi:hypothetical protein
VTDFYCPFCAYVSQYPESIVLTQEVLFCENCGEDMVQRDVK